LKDLIGEYRIGASSDLKQPIWSTCQRCGIDTDVPLLLVEGDDESKVIEPELPESLSPDIFDRWIKRLADYLEVLQERLFSSGLHVLGDKPSVDDLRSFLSAYFDDKLTEEEYEKILKYEQRDGDREWNLLDLLADFVKNFVSHFDNQEEEDNNDSIATARDIVSLLNRNTEELDGVLNLLDGGYIPPAPGGDLLRDGASVLPTGRNIHALDPYRMPAEGAWIRGQSIAEETIRQHLADNDGAYPETIACTLWGLDTIKTRGTSI